MCFKWTRFEKLSVLLFHWLVKSLVKFKVAISYWGVLKTCKHNDSCRSTLIATWLRGQYVGICLYNGSGVLMLNSEQPPAGGRAGSCVLALDVQVFSNWWNELIPQVFWRSEKTACDTATSISGVLEFLESHQVSKSSYEGSWSSWSHIRCLNVFISGVLELQESHQVSKRLHIRGPGVPGVTSGIEDSLYQSS